MNRPSCSPTDTPEQSIPVPLLDVARQNDPLSEEITAAIGRVVASGHFLFGPDCSEFEQEMAEYCHTKHAVACASGSDALLLALMANEIGQGDEVILPSFTFFATAGAVSRLGAIPVFADIDPVTFQIDPQQIEKLITPATKAIIPVHLFGACADMTAICGIALDHQIPIIEDAAQAIGAEHLGRRAGSLGQVGCFSFYPTKNLGGMGDGGILTTDDEPLAARLRILRDHGQSPRYHHSLVGINSRLDSIQAAVLRIKLRHLDDWTTMRDHNAQVYTKLLAEHAGKHSVVCPTTNDESRHVWNQYTIRVPQASRDALQAHLGSARIGSAIYYPIPLHLQECFASLGYAPGSLPESERAAKEVLSLPIFPELSEAELQTVAAEVRRFFSQAQTVAKQADRAA